MGMLRNVVLLCKQKLLHETTSVSIKRFLDAVTRPDASYRDVVRTFMKHTDALTDDEIDDIIVSRVTSFPAKPGNVIDNHEWDQTMAAVDNSASVTSSSSFDENENRLVGE